MNDFFASFDVPEKLHFCLDDTVYIIHFNQISLQKDYACISL